MFKLLVDFVFWLITKIASLIFAPITMLLTRLIPDLGDLVENIQLFFTEHVFNTLQWTKMFLLNCLAFPTDLLYFLIAVFEILITIHVGMLMYKGVMTIYQKFKP